MNVELPDGTVIEDVPEGTTRAQLAEKLRRSGMAVPKEWGAKTPNDYIADMQKRRVTDVAAVLRGAGSIGSTLLMKPEEIGRRLFSRPGLNELVTGQPKPDADQQRRADMDEALRMLGADTESPRFKGLKLTTEVAGTLGVGGALGKGAQAIGAPAAVVRALQSAGFTTGNTPVGVGGRVADAALRSVAGGAAGAGAAGLVNPEDAATGGLVGAALPAGVRAFGEAGRVMGRAFGRPDEARRKLAETAITKYGLPLSPADVSSNPIVKGARSFLDDVPLIGAMGARQREAVQGGYNKAIGGTFGEAAEKLTPAVMDRASKRMGAEFNRLWGRNQLQYDGQLFTDLQSLRNEVKRLPQGDDARLARWIDDIESRFVPDVNGNPMMPGDVANRLQSKLRKEVDSASGFVKNGLSNLRRSLLDAFNRGISHADAAALTKARGEYRAFKTVEPLVQKAEAGVAGRSIGDVPAALVPEAVRKTYGSRIAQSPFADLSQIGSQFVTDRVARTGGSARAMIQNSALGSALATGAITNPLTLLAVPTAAGVEAALTSPAIARLLMAGRPGAMNPLLELGYQAAPVLSTGR